MESTTDVCQSLERRQILRKSLFFDVCKRFREHQRPRTLFLLLEFISFRLCNPLHHHTRQEFFSCDGIGDPGIHLGCMSHFHHFLYQHNVTIYTNHTAVKAVLETENPTAKYGWGVTNVRIKQEERTRPRSFRQPSLASTCCRNWGRMKLRFPPLLLKASGETVLPNICHQCHTQFVWQTIRDKEWSTHLKEFRRLTRPVWDVRCCCWLSDVSTEANSLNYPSS